MTQMKITDEQKTKLFAATKKYFLRVRALGRKHRSKIGDLLHQLDDKHVQAIKEMIEKKRTP